MTSVFERTQID